MPYEWTAPPTGNIPDTSPDIPRAELHLWPYRSLPRRGFVWFIGITAVMISLPVIGLIGSPLLWALLPFPAAAVAGIWWAIERSYADGAIREELCLWSDRVSLTRHARRKPTQVWEANPHWVQVGLHVSGGPVEDYLTLKGAGREVEIGAFLTVSERRTLYAELSQRLRKVI